jgi:Fe-S cluster biogenesis protein NfuA
MFIQTEATPNPATLKFLPGTPVLERGTADFPNEAAAERSPLAQRLFAIDGVSGVFLGAEFISVTKDAEKDWQFMKPLVLSAVMDHFTQGEPVLLDAGDDAGDDADDGAGDDGDGGPVTRIKELIETRVRPAVMQDGGDIVFHGFEDGIVYLRMQGACAGCPSSTATLKHGIENMLRHYVPEVTEVQAVE